MGFFDGTIYGALFNKGFIINTTQNTAFMGSPLSYRNYNVKPCPHSDFLGSLVNQKEVQ